MGGRAVKQRSEVSSESQQNWQVDRKWRRIVARISAASRAGAQEELIAVCLRVCVRRRPWWSRSVLEPSYVSWTCIRRCSGAATLPCWLWIPNTEGKASVSLSAHDTAQPNLPLMQMCHLDNTYTALVRYCIPNLSDISHPLPDHHMAG